MNLSQNLNWKCQNMKWVSIFLSLMISADYFPKRRRTEARSAPNHLHVASNEAALCKTLRWAENEYLYLHNYFHGLCEALFTTPNYFILFIIFYLFFYQFWYIFVVFILFMGVYIMLYSSLTGLFFKISIINLCCYCDLYLKNTFC